MMRRPRLQWIAAMSLVGACTDPPIQTSGDGTSSSGGSDGVTTSMPTTNTPTSTTDTSEGDTSGADTTAGTSATTGPPPDTSSTSSTGGTQGCSEIDLLFVIDNSGSMGDEQTRLLTAFPVFIAELTGQFPGSDLNIMVTDVDGWPFAVCEAPGGHCSPPPECVAMDGTCNVGGPGCFPVCLYELPCEQAGYTCDGFPHEACDEALGAGVVETWGPDSSSQACNLSSGARYIDASEPNVIGAFECIAQVGTGSFAETEQPMEALVQAVTPGTDAFSCNEGFLRDDALLVVTFITDEDDGLTDSAGSPASWHLAVLDAKGGDPDAVVVLGLFGDGDLPESICAPTPDEGGAETSIRLRAFLDLWGEHGTFGSICAASYAPFFSETVDVIDGACGA